MCRLEVNISQNQINYPIHINNRDISSLNSDIFELIQDKKYVVVISQKVYKIYGKILNFPKENIFILKDGENQKNFKNYKKILEFILKKQLTRQDYIIAIGGGVVGDIAGFTASTYMRGIKFIQVPTTLLSATDSSVGGKTAINTDYGKNLVGSFYQPNAVFINVNFLKTLDQKQYLSGLGEVLKYAFIEKSCQLNEDLNLINFLSENFVKINNKDILTLRELIEMCLKLKISVVSKDEKESGLRRILNYGHTYGHAVENLTRYKKYTHGECVVFGILQALEIAYNMGKIDKEYKFLCTDLVTKFGFNSNPKFSANKIINIMKTDKKSQDNTINYVLPYGYSCVECSKLTFEQIKSELE